MFNVSGKYNFSETFRIIIFPDYYMNYLRTRKQENKENRITRKNPEEKEYV